MRGALSILSGGWSDRVGFLMFGSIDDGDNLASWSVTRLPAGYTGRLSVEGMTVYLEIHANGTLISLR